MPIIKDSQVINGQEVTIHIQVDEPLQPAQSPFEDLRDGTGGADRVINAVRDLFGDAMELVHSCAIRVVNTIQTIDRSVRPDEFEVQMAIQLNTEVGAILAKMGNEAQLQVTMRWTHKDDV